METRLFLVRLLFAIVVMTMMVACNMEQPEIGSPAPAVSTASAPTVPGSTETAPAPPDSTPALMTPPPDATVPPEQIETPASTIAAQICDPLNDFTLLLPEGWSAHIPGQGLMGTTTLINYTEADILALGTRAQEGVFPPGGIKVDIMSFPVLPGGFDEFVDEQIGSTLSGPGADRRAVSEPQPYEIAGYSGVAYTITEEAATEQVSVPPPVQVIIFPIAEERVTTMTIIPSDSTAYNEALALLSTYRAEECAN